MFSCLEEFQSSFFKLINFVWLHLMNEHLFQGNQLSYELHLKTMKYYHSKFHCHFSSKRKAIFSKGHRCYSSQNLYTKNQRLLLIRTFLHWQELLLPLGFFNHSNQAILHRMEFTYKVQLDLAYRMSLRWDWTNQRNRYLLLVVWHW